MNIRPRGHGQLMSAFVAAGAKTVQSRCRMADMRDVQGVTVCHRAVMKGCHFWHKVSVIHSGDEDEKVTSYLTRMIRRPRSP
jgi:hypothetical protein